MELTIAELLDFLDKYGERDDDLQFNITAAHQHTALRELGFDSLGIFNVMVRVGDTHDAEIPYDDVVQAQTPAEVLVVINKALATKSD